MSEQHLNVKDLVLDAGPILSLSPLRGLAQRYLTTPQVLAELKDKRAREHFERLGLTAGVQVEVRQPDSVSLAKVTLFAKKTGDYAVLSPADLAVLALTYGLDEEYKRKRAEAPADDPPSGEPLAPESETASNQEPESDPSITTDSSTPKESGTTPEPAVKEESAVAEPVEVEDGSDSSEEDTENEFPRVPLDAELDDSSSPASVPQEPISDDQKPESTPETSSSDDKEQPDEPQSDDLDDDDDDGEGEWITPSNVAVHKARALALLPNAATGKQKQSKEPMGVGCMTADYAMQNVLLQMGLNLVGVEGQRISQVKSWVLRCHACFKLCKDSTKKFCPSCGGPTLLRTSVTTTAGTATSPPKVQVHLKKNFQYRNRGTVYSIPAPKPGTSKTGPGTGLILREDQTEFMRAMQREEGRLQKEERKLVSAVAGAKSAGEGVRIGNWQDPDWMPEMLRVGMSGKGRRGPSDNLPTVGYGRKNPNEKRRQ